MLEGKLGVPSKKIITQLDDGFSQKKIEIVFELFS
jgi:hypothetical protein